MRRGAVASPSGLPVARLYPPIALVGDQLVETDPTALADTGCYSFGAVITPIAGAAFTMPPGDPAETLRVVPAAVIPPWRVDLPGLRAPGSASGGQVRTGSRSAVCSRTGC